MTATPIYDQLIHELGDPHASPTEALVTYNAINDFCDTVIPLLHERLLAAMQVIIAVIGL